MDLLSDIQTKWATTAAIVASVPNGLHIDEAPENTPLPFATILQAESDTDARFAGQLPCEIVIDFTVFSESDADALASMAIITAAFDNTPLGTGGYFCNRLTAPTVHRHPHGSSTGWNLIDRNASVNPIYTASVTYVFAMNQA